ncbi:MAG: sodium:proton antiporter [Firmicutes bacterium]|nr:sodium:proton antiporter [Bacillota bacterium]
MAYLCFAGFSAALLLCVITGRSMVYALTLGLALFLLYGKKEGHTWYELLRMCWRGIWRNRYIFLNFVFIGMLTASWRASGAIPYVVTAATGLIRPSIFLFMAFVLCCLISFLTGTALGTAATMGVISMAMASAMDVNAVLAGGAVLSGSYFGDRMSSVSSSALLVSGLTETDIYDNIHNMAKSCAVPFAATCLVYLAVGLTTHHGNVVPDLRGMFAQEFVLNPLCVLPAVVLLALAALKKNMRITMGFSTLTAIVLMLTLQHTDLAELPLLLWRGYRTADPALAAVLNGGGILSMRRMALIFTYVSAFSGIFHGTQLLQGLHSLVHRLSQKTVPFGASYLTALVTSVISCNQTLNVVLTHELCGDLYETKSEAALALEDSAIVTCAYWPWSIGAVSILSAIDAPDLSIVLAFYIFLLPLWHLISDIRKARVRTPRSS